MKASQLKQLIREEVRKAVKEIGDSSAGAYPVQGLQSVIGRLKKEIAQGKKATFTGNVKDRAAGNISFTAEDGAKKEIYVGLNFNKKNNGYTMDVFVYNPNWKGDPNTKFIAGEGNLYKLMATVSAVCKKITDSIPEINELQFESWPKWSKEDAPDETVAMKFILKYVKQVYGSNINIKNDYGDIYIKLLDRIATK